LFWVGVVSVLPGDRFFRFLVFCAAERRGRRAQGITKMLPTAVVSMVFVAALLFAA